MSARRKPTLDGLIAALRKADAALSAAIDKHNDIDKRAFAQRKATGSQSPTRQQAAAGRAEGLAHEQISDALGTLCRYRPRTPEELSSYIVTLLNHWRITDGTLEEDRDRACFVALLSNVNAATAALVFRG